MNTRTLSNDDNKNKVKCTVLGSGAIGTAIASGLIAGGFDREQLSLIQRNPEKRESLVEEGYSVYENLSAKQLQGVLFICVRPENVTSVLRSIPFPSAEDLIVVSVASGVSLETIRRFVPGHIPVFRIKPNIWVEFGQGNILMAEDKTNHKKHQEFLSPVLSKLGEVFVLPEEQLEEFGWESLSIPTVIIPKILKERIDAVPMKYRETVAKMLISGLAGAVTFLKNEEDKSETEKTEDSNSLSALVDLLCTRVATPNGVNGAALKTLERNSFWQSFSEARLSYRLAEYQLKEKTSSEAV